MARVIRVHETGGPEVLKVEEVDVPAPAAGEVQIRVKAMVIMHFPNHGLAQVAPVRSGSVLA